MKKHGTLSRGKLGVITTEKRLNSDITIYEVDGHKTGFNFERMFPMLTDDQMYDYAFSGDVAPEDEPAVMPERGHDAN